MEAKNKTEVKDIILMEPKRKELSRWTMWLERNFTEARVFPNAEAFQRLVEGKRIEVRTNSARFIPPSDLSFLDNRREPTAKGLVNAAAFFLSCPANLAQYVRSLSDKEVQLWKLNLKKVYTSDRMLVDATGQSWMKKKNDSFYADYIILTDGEWFKYVYSDSDLERGYGYRLHEAYLYLPPVYRRVFAPLFFPEIKAVPDAHDELPNRRLTVFHSELDLMQGYSSLKDMYRKKVLTVGKKNILITTVKKVLKQVSLKEFFGGDGPNELVYARSIAALTLMTLLFQNHPKGDQPFEDLMKGFVESLNQNQVFLLPLLLSHISGFRSCKLKYSTIPELLEETVSILTRANSGWISVDDIKDSLLIYPADEDSLEILRPRHVIGMYMSNKVTGVNIHLGNHVDELGDPILRGLLFLMGSVGLLELAYEKPKPTDATLYGGLRYVRLTQLGKYAFGIIPSYLPPTVENPQEIFELDDRRLIIRVMKEDNPYEGLLADIAVPIGNHRYRVSNESFLKKCQSKKDVKGKIEFFKHFIYQKKEPAIWKRFFESLLKQCNPLELQDASRYVLYQLDGKDEGLLRLLTTDPVLKTLIIRAEGYRILVEKSNQKQLMERLKAYGYLL